MEILKEAFQSPLEDECYMISTKAIHDIEANAITTDNYSLVKADAPDTEDWAHLELLSTTIEGKDYELIPNTHWATLKAKYHIKPEIKLDVLKAVDFFETGKHKCTKVFGSIDRSPMKLKINIDGKIITTLISKNMKLNEFAQKYGNNSSIMIVNGYKEFNVQFEKNSLCSNNVHENDEIAFRMDNKEAKKGKADRAQEFEEYYQKSLQIKELISLQPKTPQEILENLFQNEPSIVNK